MAQPPTGNRGRPREVSLQAEVEELRISNKKLLQTVEELQRRLDTLERARDGALNHIDWAIDSLHTVIGDRASKRP
jgi:FtsZ-binding cell division protein ZapB